MNTLLYGLFTGVLFGYFLQRARVLRYDKQIAALLFQDMTIVKFMLSAIAVGMAGVYLLHDAGAAKLSIKPAILGGTIFGGLCFGVGWGLLGYCPGTSLGALGEGRWDALWGILGMLAGAGLFAEAYPFVKKTILGWGDYGKLTLPQILRVSHWLVIPCLILAIVVLYAWFEKKKL